MPSWNCLNNTSDLMVLDASVVINLIATQDDEVILASLPNRVVVTDQAAIEVRRGVSSRSSTGRAGGKPTSMLQRLEIVSLEGAAVSIFLDLVEGSGSQTVGDGEAATIAYAHENDGISVMDDRKALRVCLERFPDIRTASTMDILTHYRVGEAFGNDRTASLVFEALQNARMRVPASYHRWTVDLIGQDRATQCLSLPSRIRDPIQTA